MLSNHRQIETSFHTDLYRLIPEDHLLRKINASVDFSFIFDLVRTTYCEFYGRPANEPEVLFRLLFLQTLYSLSDERVVQEAQVNLAYKWFLGLNPEDSLPNPSQLSRFRNHRLGASEVDEVLKSVARQCIDKGIIKSKTLILDATHTHASVQRERPIEVLQNAAKRLFRVVVKKHPKLEKKLPRMPRLEKDATDGEKIMLHYLAELGETVEEFLPDHEGAIREKIQIAKQIVEDERLLSNKGILSAIDPDARFGWKSSTTSFFGYKEHIAMTEEEIITAVKVTTGTEDDGKQLGDLLKQSLESGMKVEEIIADTAYSGKDNLAIMKKETIQPVVPLNPIVHEGGQKQEGFEYNKDADMVLCPAGERSIRKAVQGSKTSGNSRSLVYYFNVEKCKTCPLREGCYKPGAKSKTYSIRLVAEHYQEQIEFELSDTFKERIKRRPIIEHKNAELKRYHGLTRAKYRGLARMQLQAIIAAFVVNAKRMSKLDTTKKQPLLT
ncbi:MAG TPA: IS1182 family transposase [Anaerovoracaceae bacterium]|nr:IS1182 family transposase [Anaerovoracaceae bacterium]